MTPETPYLPRLSTKALANLKASKRLHDARLIDPAMSRLYYALFQAGVHAHSVAGRAASSVKAGVTEWDHTLLCNTTLQMRNQVADRKLFLEAKSLRAQADYMEIPVQEAQFTALLPAVEQFVVEVCQR